MLKTIYATAEEIPDGYADLYTERNGQWELTGVQGVKTQADVDRVSEALRKEKTEHRKAKEALALVDGIDPVEVENLRTQLEDKTAQLEAVNKDGRIDETKMEPIILARVKQATAPLERDKVNLERKVDTLNKSLLDKDGEVINLKTSITTDSIERTIRDEAVSAKVQVTALDDVTLRGSRVFEKTEDGRIVTKDVNGVVPGLTVKEWLKDMQEKAPHWWPGSIGGGSNGGGGGGGPGLSNNPWSKEHWNMTKQGALVRQLGEEKAGAIAARVGSKIGDTKPAG